jgi:hypothetical protein
MTSVSPPLYFLFPKLNRYGFWRQERRFPELPTILVAPGKAWGRGVIFAKMMSSQRPEIGSHIRMIGDK